MGIALALALDAEVYHATEADDNAAEYRAWTTTLFGMVGGVAFFTLVVNGSLSGPLLHRLGSRVKCNETENSATFCQEHQGSSSG